MAILVTGGAGYIGSHLVWELFERGRPVVALDDLSTGAPWVLPPRVRLHVGNVGDGSMLRRIFDADAITHVVHLAGSTILPESVENPLKYYANNTCNSRSLIEVAVHHGVRGFVFSSTAAVYADRAGGRLIPESAPVGPQSPYGWSKLMVEQMLVDASRAHPLKHVTLRYFNVAGADPLGRTGQVVKGATHLIKVACEAAVGLREYMTVYGTDFETDDGTGVRDYIHVSDLAMAHVNALEYCELDSTGSVALNCGYGRGHSVRDVIRMVQAVSGTTLEVREGARRPGDRGSVVADPSRARRELGWQPKHDSLEQIVTDALAWERRLPSIRRQRGHGAEAASL